MKNVDDGTTHTKPFDIFLYLNKIGLVVNLSYLLDQKSLTSWLICLEKMELIEFLYNTCVCMC